MDVCEEREESREEFEAPAGANADGRPSAQDVWLVVDLIELVRPSSGHSLTIPGGEVLTDEERRELVPLLIEWVREIRKNKRSKT